MFQKLTQRVREAHTRPYLKQSVSLTALGVEGFQTAVESIEEIHRLFSRNFPEGALEGWAPSQFEGFLTIDAANRFFTHCSLANAADIIPFSTTIDPDGVLKKGITERYIHTSENVVEYYEKTTVGERTRSEYIDNYTGHYLSLSRYISINPVKFQYGDIVEAQVSFQTVALKGGKYKMLVVLRALTLLDAMPTKVRSSLNAVQ